MRKFAQPQGITFTIPSFGAPGTEIKAFQGYLLLIVGDTLAVADLIGFKKSFSRRAYHCVGNAIAKVCVLLCACGHLGLCCATLSHMSTEHTFVLLDRKPNQATQRFPIAHTS